MPYPSAASGGRTVGHRMNFVNELINSSVTVGSEGKEKYKSVVVMAVVVMASCLGEHSAHLSQTQGSC